MRFGEFEWGKWKNDRNGDVVVVVFFLAARGNDANKTTNKYRFSIFSRADNSISK